MASEVITAGGQVTPTLALGGATTGCASLFSFNVCDLLLTEFHLAGHSDDSTLGVGVLEAHLDSAVLVDGGVLSVGNDVELTLELLGGLDFEVFDLSHGLLAGVNDFLGFLGCLPGLLNLLPLSEAVHVVLDQELDGLLVGVADVGGGTG